MERTPRSNRVGHRSSLSDRCYQTRSGCLEGGEGGERRREEGEIPFSFAIRLPGFVKGLKKKKSCSVFCRRDPDVM